MATTAEIIKQMRKEHGDGVVHIGGDFADIERIPTGIFALDLATGGGLPKGRCSIIFGPESSNKTNIVLGTIAQGQIKYPGKMGVFIDAEHAYDPIWAAKLGVDVDRLIVVAPDNAEQAVDAAESFLHASDVFAVALDSIAALVTQREIDNSADVQAVGGASLLIGKLYKKTVVSFSKMRKAGIMPPAFIGINQIRYKIGSMHDPETMPGGNAPRFASSMTIRCYGKNENDSKISKSMPAWKAVNCILKKWKVPILAQKAEFMQQMIDGDGRPAGFVSDWNTVAAYMKELDYLTKGDKPGSWTMLGDEYSTKKECQEVLYGNPKLLQEVKETLIKEMVERGTLEESDGELDVD